MSYIVPIQVSYSETGPRMAFSGLAMRGIPSEIRTLVQHDRKWLWILFCLAGFSAFLLGAELITFLILGQTLVGESVSNLPGGAVLERFLGDYSASEVLVRVAAAFGGVVVLRALALFGYSYLTYMWAGMATARLHKEVMGSLVSAPTSIFDTRRPGDIIHGVMEAPLVVTYAIDGVSGLITSIFTTSLVGIALLYISPWMLVAGAAIGIPMLLAVANPAQRQIKYLKTRYIRERTAATQMASNVISGIRDIKALATESRIVASFGQEMARAEKSGAYTRTLKALPGPAMQAAFQVAFAVAIIVLASVMTAEALVAFLPYLAVLGYSLMRVYPAATKVAKSWLDIGQALPGLQVAAEWAALPEDTLAHGTRQAPSRFEGIRFENVCFSYDGDALAIIDMDFHIAAGKVTGLVGASGAGKSTMLDLLLKFRMPDTGTVWLGEHDLSDVVRSSWLKDIGVVRQDVFFFAGTIRENLLAWKPGAPEEELVNACIQASALDFISDLADGFDTVVGDRGVTLSGGQRQRIALARALLRDPQVLILDEALSALDGETETQVLEPLLRNSAQRTILLVSHRLTTIENSDHIIVLDHGRVAEQGSHTELLNRHGRYSQLFSTQMSLAEVEAG